MNKQWFGSLGDVVSLESPELHLWYPNHSSAKFQTILPNQGVVSIVERKTGSIHVYTQNILSLALFSHEFIIKAIESLKIKYRISV